MRETHWGLEPDDDPLRDVVDRVTAVLPPLAALPSGIHHDSLARAIDDLEEAR